MKIKSILIAATIGVASLTTVSTFSGCDTIKSLLSNDTVQTVVVSLTKAAAKAAVSIGFSELKDGVSELDDYDAVIDGLEDSILDLIDNAVDADSAATASVLAIQQSDLDDEQQAVVVSSLMSSLESESEAEAGTTAAAPVGAASDYGGPLYAALAKYKSSLSD